MKYWADSAAQAISIAATRMAGAVQKTEYGLSSAMGIGAPAMSASANTGAATCRGLSEFDLILVGHQGVLFERGPRGGKIGTVVGAAAFLARERTACNELCNSVDVARFESAERRGRVAQLRVLQLAKRVAETRGLAHNAAVERRDAPQFVTRYGRKQWLHRGAAFGCFTRIIAHRGTRARAEHHAFQERIAGKPVGSVHSGAGGLPRGVQAGNVRSAAQVRAHTAHGVMRSGMHRSGGLREVE